MVSVLITTVTPTGSESKEPKHITLSMMEIGDCTDGALESTSETAFVHKPFSLVPSYVVGVPSTQKAMVNALLSYQTGPYESSIGLL